jgi:hypothetical protein
MASTEKSSKPTDLTEVNVEELWQAVIESLHRGPVNRSLWDAVAHAKPLVIEDNELVIGFSPRDMRHAGYLQTASNRARIQDVLLARTGHRLQLRVIEGDTIDAWRRVKQIERLAEERAEEQVREVQARAQSVHAWADLNEALIKLFSAAGLRRYPITLARMLAKALAMVYETDATVRADDPEGTAYHDRELNRICDKLATYCDLPSTMVAMEYLRFRASRRSGEGKGQ